MAAEAVSGAGYFPAAPYRPGNFPSAQHAYPPAPRLRRRKKTRLQVSPRLQRVLLVGVLVLGLGYTVAFSWRAFQQAALLDTRLEAARQTLAEAQARQVRLQAEQAYMQTDAAVEKLAREELGLVKPGEVRIVVERPDGPDPKAGKP